MARATRSSAHPDKHEQPPPLPVSRPKKRKRPSSPNLPLKQSRQDDTAALNVLDTPILDNHAQAILDILEMIDTQGLLDRVFPLPEDPSASLSLRALLKQPSQHPLRVLRAAVKNLFPISSLPRSRPSPTATQQLRFCNLALSLLSQASHHSLPVPPSLSSILPKDESAAESPSSISARKYALVQHLPTGDYWTSLNTDADLTTALSDLPTANVELVAILPTPAETSTRAVPTLSLYRPTKPLPPPKPLPAQRRVTTATFLDYGIWASFAPAYDYDGQYVGRSELGQVLYSREEKRKKSAQSVQAPTEEDSIQEILPSPQPIPMQTVDDQELNELLPSDQVEAIKSALGSLALENAVQELLDRNSKALMRLEELQQARIMKEDGATSTVPEGSEEWEIAQGIMESLSVLASLRPHTLPSDSEEKPPISIVPSSSVLRKLHRSLALEPKPGWHGTLPPTRATALRDDNTIKMRPVTTPAPAPATAAAAAPVTTPAAVPPAAMTTPLTYSGYTYAYGTNAAQQAQYAQSQQPYRTGTTPVPTTTYTPYKAPAYYQYATAQAGVGIPLQQSYYGQQQQGYAAAAYSGWYNTYQTMNLGMMMGNTALTAGGSGRGTPQPQTGTASTITSGGAGAGTSVTVPPSAAAAVPTYGSFFSSVGVGTPPPAGVRTPAVANTVYGQPTQTQGAQGVVPTLPVHLRPGVPAGQTVQQTSSTYQGTHQPATR